MNYETLELSVDTRGIARLTLNRPLVHNAISAQMIGELTQAAERLGQDETVRAVVLTGAGKSFCAGGDLNWMRAQMAADAKVRAEGARALGRMLFALNTLPKPVIGRVQGQAFGGGIGLMSVCDVVVAVGSSVFGLTETRLGLIPATIGPFVMARMGEAFARQVFMSSRRFSAQEAQTFGLVAKVVACDRLDAAVEAEVLPYLDCAPFAVAAAKKMTRELGLNIDEEVMENSVQALVKQWEGDEAAEGIAAFFDKRKPSWAGC